jgi:S-adenosylmethionine-diacylglycerol 3-amino-3-carboxypropyl transferase
MVQKYFNQLNYTLGNEDTSVDLEIVKRLGSKSIFNVAGCGSRSFPLLESCEELHMVDISEYQLALCRLREALYRHLSFNEFMIFWDFPPFNGQDNSYERKKIFQSLELHENDRDFFRTILQENNWQSLLYLGKWERTFQTMSNALRLILGKSYKDIFSFHSLEEQKDYYRSKFPRTKWNALLFLLGNKSVFNALLYKGDFIEKNVEENHFQYYQSSFDTLFENNLARESFFAHLCFHGKIIHSDGNPIEAVEENFNAVKEKLLAGARVGYHQGDLVSLLASDEHRDQYDYIGLSDVPSYFKGSVEKEFLQKLKTSLKAGGVVCLRNYLRIPEADTTGFESIGHQFKDLYSYEKVGVYRFQLYQKI